MNDFCEILKLIHILLILYSMNTILGIIINTKENNFNISKFKNGIIKVLIFCICIIGYCYCLKFFPIILSKINVEIHDNTISFMEVVGIILTIYKKYITDCYEKIKIFLKL